MKTILFIGQAPARPSSKHEIPGTYLHPWLHRIGLTEKIIHEHCHFYALTDAFPGSSKAGHLPPTKEQIALYRPILKEIIVRLRPDIIVPVGKLAIIELLDQKNVSLETTIGQKIFINPFHVSEHPIPCIPLSHPSGVSAWNHRHKDLVIQALTLLKQEIS